MSLCVLTIAGSDPGGGAGVQADIRTLTALGVCVLSAITAITAQNSLGVFGVYPVEPDILAAQINRLLDDARPDAIKIGMLGGAKQVEAIVEIFEKRRPSNVVLDPVLASTGGVPLLDASGRYLLITSLIKHCALITPNISEAEMLTGLPIKDEAGMTNAGRQLLSMGAQAVLVKGGHLPGDPSDLLIQRGKEPIRLAGHRVRTTHTHGTGCLLSSAIAARLAQGLPLNEAAVSAKNLVSESLMHPTICGQGRGYPNAADAIAAKPSDTSLLHQARLKKFKGLYVITDPVLQAGRSNEEVALKALAGGAQIFQLRDKTLSTPALVEQARQLSDIVHRSEKLFIVNDRVDIALASDADGVHLGPDDMSPADVRKLLGPDKLVGVSTGTVEEASAAAPYASYF